METVESLKGLGIVRSATFAGSLNIEKHSKENMRIAMPTHHVKPSCPWMFKVRVLPLLVR